MVVTDAFEFKGFATSTYMARHESGLSRAKTGAQLVFCFCDNFRLGRQRCGSNGTGRGNQTEWRNATLFHLPKRARSRLPN